MLMGHTEGLPEREHLLGDPVTHPDDEDEHEEVEQHENVISEEILYEASFEELSSANLNYDTVIWVSISLLLVLAWGIGAFMLLYLPVRRYVLRREISSRKMYVTRDEIVLKVSRPLFIPLWGVTSIEKRIPLNMVIEVVIEQGFLQAIYGIHTFKIGSIAHGKAAPVDELQVQGVDEPHVLRSVIVREAAKNAGSLTEGSISFMSPSKNWKVTGSPFKSSMDMRGSAYVDMMLSKIEEVMNSAKKLEMIIQKSLPSSENVVET